MTKSRGQSGTLLKEQGSTDLEISLGGINGCQKGLHGSGMKGLYSILFYSSTFYIKYNEIKVFAK